MVLNHQPHSHAGTHDRPKAASRRTRLPTGRLGAPPRTKPRVPLGTRGWVTTPAELAVHMGSPHRSAKRLTPMGSPVPVICWPRHSQYVNSYSSNPMLSLISINIACEVFFLTNKPTRLMMSHFTIPKGVHAEERKSSRALHWLCL